MLCCAQLCQCFLSHPVANPHSRSIAPNRPTFAQRQQCGLDHTNPGLLRDLQFLSVFMCNRALGTVWCAFCRPPHLPKVPRDRPSVFFHFEVQIALSLQSCDVLCTFCRQLCRIKPRSCGNRDSTSATPRATLHEKSTGFRARECFHP